MNYRHLYHAGNFAEVFKHVLLIALIQELTRKDKPLCYLETHAGIGYYDLYSLEAQKTAEHTGGITKLWPLCSSNIVKNNEDVSNSIPSLISDYFQAVQAWNIAQASTELRFYPGSPVLARHFLRAHDKMILTEFHPQDVLLLKQRFAEDSHTAVHYLDGYQALKAFLPPKERRGLVFIDPSFEKVDEFAHIAEQLQLALRRWHTGIYALWYPIKSKSEIKYFYRQLQCSGIRNILCCEIKLPQSITALNACGMIVIHPPWQWQERVANTLPWLCHALSVPQLGEYRIQWLVPE